MLRKEWEKRRGPLALQAPKIAIRLGYRFQLLKRRIPQFTLVKRRRLLSDLSPRFWLASLALLAVLLAACGPIIDVIPPAPAAAFTPTPDKSPTAMFTATETPAAIVKLDKPMTTEFSPTNIEAMPTTNEEMVRAGQLGEAVRQYWQETGLINPDGSVNKPENVLAAKPDQWTVWTSPGSVSLSIPAGDQILVPKYDLDKLPKASDYPFQPTNLQFKVEGSSGKVIGILVTEALYYEDNQGQINVVPVFFFIDQSRISEVTEKQIAQLFGHTEVGDIALPYVGVKKGETGGTYLGPYTDKEAILNEPMQPDRENFATKVAESGNPEGIENFWWGASISIINRRKIN